jgi:hypothetical protein
MSAANLCPARRYDDPEGPAEERVICIHAPHVPGAFGFVCRGCWEAMLKGAADREGVRQEWELEP